MKKKCSDSHASLAVKIIFELFVEVSKNNDNYCKFIILSRCWNIPKNTARYCRKHESLVKRALRSTHSEASWARGMPASAIQTVFQAIVASKLSYASPAWWGFANMADRNLNPFGAGQSVLAIVIQPMRLSDICDRADDKLFRNIISRGHRHLLYPLFPPERGQHYSFRKCPHNFQLPPRVRSV